MITPHLDALDDYFARGVAAGVFSAGVDYALVLEMLLGGMVMTEALRGDVPDDWPDGVVDLVWPLISNHHGLPQSGQAS